MSSAIVMAEPEFRSRHCPIEQSVNIDTDLVSYRDCLLHLDQIHLVPEMIRMAQIKVIDIDQGFNFLFFPLRYTIQFLGKYFKSFLVIRFSIPIVRLAGPCEQVQQRSPRFGQGFA